MTDCSCGFILATRCNGWLLCHPTNGGPRWDFPKGCADEGEDHLAAAVRELEEETGVHLSPTQLLDVVDLGQHPYRPKKDLHLYFLQVLHLSPKLMECTSMVTNAKGAPFPEMDAFAVFPVEKALERVTPRMKQWISLYLPEEHLAVYD